MKPWLAVVAVLLLAVIAASAQSAPLRIVSFHAAIDAAEDGSAVVLETWDVAGGPGSVLVRRLPVEAAGPLGGRKRLFLRVVRVADAHSRTLDYSVRSRYRELEIRVPLPAASSATVQLSYFVRNFVRYAPGHDELYWDLMGSGLAVPAESVLARVMLPDAAAGSLRAQAVLPRAGPAPVAIQGSAVEIDPGTVPARSGLVVDVFVAKGVFHEPGPLLRAWWFVASNPILLMPALVLALILAIRAWGARVPATATTIYGPPEDLTPAEAGMLLDDRFTARDVTATLFDLAVRGYLRIEEDRDTPPEHRDYFIRLSKPRDQWQGLAAHEQTMMFNTFYGGQWTKLSSLRLRFAVAVPAMRMDVLTTLVHKGMYRFDPRISPALRLVGVAGFGFVLVLAQLLGIVSLFQSGVLALLAIAASAAIVYWFGRRVTPKSAKGLRVCAQIEGFREFLNRVDAGRLEQFTAERFERCPPYAMALGVEHHWEQTFAGIAREAPPWYQMAGAEGFDARLWASGLDNMAQHASVAFTSVPRGGKIGAAVANAARGASAG